MSYSMKVSIGLLIAGLMIFVSCQEQKSIQTEDGWPVLKHYDQDHTSKIAMPLGGIGTGTVSLSGRGELIDWEIMGRPAKGFNPSIQGGNSPFFAIYTKTKDGPAVARALMGPLDESLYEGSTGSPVPNHGLPRFSECSFDAAYPFGQVNLSDQNVPVDVRFKAFNPLVPADPDASGIPVAILKYEVTNKTADQVDISICGSMHNFIGINGTDVYRGWSGEWQPKGADLNVNKYRSSEQLKGIFMTSEGVSEKSETWGTIALTTTAKEGISYQTGTGPTGWGTHKLRFWDDFSEDGVLNLVEYEQEEHMPRAALAVSTELEPGETKELTFLITWHFPNRPAWLNWDPEDEENNLTNYYATRYDDAWDVAVSTVSELEVLENRTLSFVNAFCESDFPEVVKEAALFNISTLRSQTCFRTDDGNFYGWEGCHNSRGCCAGSCTHVWNYEQATAFLYGDLAKRMRYVEFAHATSDIGLMSFRVGLPLKFAQRQNFAAADGQMGCIMKIYRDWQLSGDDQFLEKLWPGVRRALEFCWIEGGWDANKDGVMEGIQHNTMDVEYYGPNPQMGFWYLGALKAASKMAAYLEDAEFAEECGKLYEQGSKWIDENLFNGEYYVHKIEFADIAGSDVEGFILEEDINPEDPDYQLREGCLVDQLVGQFMAHVCDLGYLADQQNIQTTLKTIMKYNYKDSFTDHFNCMRSFILGDESGLLMASFPNGRPEVPFPYFSEVMTGFEYAAAVGMLYEGQTEAGLQCISNIRDRYDGKKRSPFDEAECGHHYARAMASWGAVLALSEFHYSAVDQVLTLTGKPGTWFWSNGHGFGTFSIEKEAKSIALHFEVIEGQVPIKEIKIEGYGNLLLDEPAVAQGEETYEYVIEQNNKI